MRRTGWGVAWWWRISPSGRPSSRPSALLRRLPVQQRQTLKLPLACFAAAGADLRRIDQPFVLESAGDFELDLAHIRIASDAARDTDTTPCSELPVSKLP